MVRYFSAVRKLERVSRRGLEGLQLTRDVVARLREQADAEPELASALAMLAEL